MDDVSFNNVEELCIIMKKRNDICLFFDTNMIITYYDDDDLNTQSVRKIVFDNQDRCFVTPSVVKECKKTTLGPEFIKIDYDINYQNRLQRGWERLKKTMNIGDNFKTDIIILFEVGCLAPLVPDKNIVFPFPIFITQNMKFLRRCLENPEKRQMVQDVICQSGLENLTCAYSLVGDKLEPFVRKGGGVNIDFVI